MDSAENVRLITEALNAMMDLEQVDTLLAGRYQETLYKLREDIGLAISMARRRAERKSDNG